MLWTLKQRCWHWSALAGWGPGRAGGLCCSGVLSSLFLNASMRQYLTFWISSNPGWILLLLALVCCSSEKPLKNTSATSKQKIPGTCLRNNNNLHVSDGWSVLSSTQSHLENKKTSFAPLSKAVKSQKQPWNTNLGCPDLKRDVAVVEPTWLCLEASWCQGCWKWVRNNLQMGEYLLLFFLWRQQEFFLMHMQFNFCKGKMASTSQWSRTVAYFDLPSSFSSHEVVVKS